MSNWIMKIPLFIESSSSLAPLNASLDSEQLHRVGTTWEGECGETNCVGCRQDHLLLAEMAEVDRLANEAYYGPVAYTVGLELGYITRERNGEK